MITNSQICTLKGAWQTFTHTHTPIIGGHSKRVWLSSAWGRLLVGLQVGIEADPWPTYFDAVLTWENGSGLWSCWSLFLSFLAELSFCVYDTVEFPLIVRSTFLHHFLPSVPVQSHVLPVRTLTLPVRRWNTEFFKVSFDVVLEPFLLPAWSSRTSLQFRIRTWAHRKPSRYGIRHIWHWCNNCPLDARYNSKGN